MKYSSIYSLVRHNCISVRVRQVLMLMERKQHYMHVSYFPEVPCHKSARRIFLEQLWQIVRFGSINAFYFPYGFDVKKSKEQAMYVHYQTFRDRRNQLNIKDPDNNSCILRNKLLFNVVADGLGIKTAENLFLISDKSIYSFEQKKKVSVVDFCSQCNGKHLFCKLVDGECGNGVFELKVKGNQLLVDGKDCSQTQLMDYFSKGCYLVQGYLTQHEEMRRLHSQSINSIRLVTVRDRKNKNIVVLPSILRIGTGNSNVDNTSQGGLCVGINLEDGSLKQYGFYKPQFGTKTENHPDSGVLFSSFVIPFFEEAQAQACYLHSMLPNIHSVGWDIAIGEDGPIFIEGNDNWEINGPQICNGGMMDEFRKYFL